MYLMWGERGGELIIFIVFEIVNSISNADSFCFSGFL